VTELFVCPHCGAKSWNPNDARERYCIRCHRFVDDPPYRQPKDLAAALAVLADLIRKPEELE
jgi:hypothetical protein